MFKKAIAESMKLGKKLEDLLNKFEKLEKKKGLTTVLCDKTDKEIITAKKKLTKLKSRKGE